ncbi:MAG TPA: glycoside hydrolase family 3 C-terminal domain-containing protein [Candidatus Fimivicinus intestinavium]|nr:glycoside hydrolase family 3 C-terminal domain-containing protein [Candidatus Fimivicinus intestinavium]
MNKPYNDPALSPAERTEALLREMSIEEKLAQLRGVFPFGPSWDDFDTLSRQTKNGIGQVSTLQMRDMATKEECCAWQRRVQSMIMENSPHHIPAVFHMEGLCGPFIQDSTSFPAGIARGAGWDPALERQIGRSVSRQELACGVTQTLAPVLDVSRDPRMGRYGEPYSEDETLVAALGTAYIQGLQHSETAGRRTQGVAKHFLSFHNSQGGIHGSHSFATSRELREVFAKPFQAAITEGGLAGIMPCYCSLDGVPVSASRNILQGLLREEMGFDGVCVSDYGAVRNTHTVHHVGETLEDAGLRCLAAGMDVELPEMSAYNEKMANMFRKGDADIALLNKAVRRVLVAKFSMGLFEHPFALEGTVLDAVFFDKNDRELSLRCARQSLVLLKNNGVLPLAKGLRTIAVIGPHADYADKFFGGYTHVAMAESTYAVVSSLAGVAQASGKDGGIRFVPGTKVQSDETPAIQAVLARQKPGCPSLLARLKEEMPDIRFLYAYGYPVAGGDTSGWQQALDAIRQADAAILTLGGKHGTCSIATMGEGVDSTVIGLPPCQEQFLEQAAALGKPLVGVHLDGRPLSSDGADRWLDAILECWSPAETGAQAIVEALTGAYNPSGKLPVTVAYTSGQIPILYNHPFGSSWHQGESIGFPDYVDMPHTPRYPFGFGLSYTQFVYSDLTLSAREVAAGDIIDICFTVKNTGAYAGDEVAQLYITDQKASMVRPVQQLAGFLRFHLQPGQAQRVRFTLSTTQLAFLDETMGWKIEQGTFELQVGASSQDIRLRDILYVRGDRWIDGRTRAFWAAASVGE